MKGQITLELLIAFSALTIAVHLIASAQAAENARLEEKTLELSEAAKAGSMSAFCNLMYLKGTSVDFAYFPRTDIQQERVRCFSENYYFSGPEPGVEGVRLWF
ncbi:MAG: hypothetical protein QXO69_01735 [archaeon]